MERILGAQPDINDVLPPGALGLLPGERYEVLRMDGRRRISHEMRVALYKRDGKRCRFCHETENLEIDHIVPWSAMGSDSSANLRILCSQCNKDRSNRYTYEDERRSLPISPMCRSCEPDWVEDDLSRRADLVFAFCARCQQNDYTSSRMIDLGLLP